LTLCMKEEVDLWRIRRVCPGVIRATAFCFSRKTLERFALRSGTELIFDPPKGLPAFLHRYRFRPGLLAGPLLYCAVLLILSQFVWSVEIPGADPLQASRIRSVLLEEGFGVASFQPSVNYGTLKYRLLRSLEEISFVSVNMQGCRAVVDVRFADSVPDGMEPEKPCNLVASRDGQIVSLLVQRGMRYVQKGQTVQKGDLLVGGLMDTRLGYYPVHAKAEVYARTAESYSQTVSLIRTEKIPTGRFRVKREWNFFGKRFCLPGFSCPYSSYETRVTVKHLSFGADAAVPITLTETYYYETEAFSREISPEEAEEEALRLLNEADRLRLWGVVVERCDQTVTRSDHAVTVTRDYGIIRNIAEEKEFYFEN